MQIPFHPATVSPCTIGQATSTLIKSVRLRKVEDSIYWLCHLYHYFPDQTFRLNRRMLIIAGEDCISVPVQTTASKWYERALASKDIDQMFKGAAALIQLICQTPNWYAVPDGQLYILAWRLAQKLKKKKYSGQLEFKTALSMLVSQISMDQGEKGYLDTCALHYVVKESSGYNGGVYAEALRQLAIDRGLFLARQVANIHVKAAKQISSMDDNFLGQAVHRVLGLPLGEQIAPSVHQELLAGMVEAALLEVTKKPRFPPSWALDGMHTTGTDKRFAGSLPCMLGACNVFNRTGRLDPKDEWIEDDWSSLTLYKKLEPEFPYVV